MDDFLSKLYDKFSSEYGAESVKKIMNELLKEKEEEKKKPYKVIDYPPEKEIKQNFSQEDVDSLIFNEKSTAVNKTIHITNISKSPYGATGKIDVGQKSYDIQIPLLKGEDKAFLKQYNEKDILCKADITHNEDIDAFIVSFLEIYDICSPEQKWKELLKNKSLAERIDFCIQAFGLDPKVMLYHEKIIFIFRIIPLIVEKFLMVEPSKMQIGKTETYSKLGFVPYTLLVTRANMFIDGRNGKNGIFFETPISLVIDEFTKIEDLDFITAIQIYMNGEKYIGSIQIGYNSEKKSNVSVVLLGNFKQNNLDYTKIFANRKNIFRRTIIDSRDGEALVSRINAIPNSWGCRTLSKNLIADSNTNLYNLEILKRAIPLLRKKRLNLEEIYKNLEISNSDLSVRATQSIEKNFEGFIKLLFPELIDESFSNIINKYKKELLFLYERSVEMRLVVNSQLKIINYSDNNAQDTFPALHSELKNVIFNIREPHVVTPHRIIIDLGRTIKKIPLDTVGIEQNKAEIELIKDYDEIEADYEFDEISGILKHDDFYTYEKLERTYQSGNYWTEDLKYNYLTGEVEETDISSLGNFIFYDLEINER